MSDEPLETGLIGGVEKREIKIADYDGGHTMTDVAQTFIYKSRQLLLSDYLPKIERSLEGLGDEEVWWRPNEASNSIGNLLLHLCGNVSQWIIGGVGGREVERHRQQEFDERRMLPARELLSSL